MKKGELAKAAHLLPYTMTQLNSNGNVAYDVVDSYQALIDKVMR